MKWTCTTIMPLPLGKLKMRVARNPIATSEQRVAWSLLASRPKDLCPPLRPNSGLNPQYAQPLDCSSDVEMFVNSYDR